MLARHSEAQIALDIPFRGDRDYVHSTDLFAALDGHAQQFLGTSAYLKRLTCRRRARRQVFAQFRPDPSAFGTFALATQDTILEGWLLETRMPVIRHIAFDEASIARNAICEQGRVCLRSSVQGYSAFEQLIVLLKLLCAKSRLGAWVFTAIDLDCPLTQLAPLAVQRKQLVLGRLLDATLYQDGLPAGQMQMVLPPPMV